jgi:hypothetical protein
MTAIFLTRLKVIGYRSCRSTELFFTPNITAIIGANGAGKTNLLQALMLFGQPSSAALSDETRSQRCRVEVDFTRSKKLVQYRAAITYRATESNRDEVLSFDEQWNFTGRASSRAGWISSDYGGLVPRVRNDRIYFSIPAKSKSQRLNLPDWVANILLLFMT